ncbi:histidine phosphatase family protein [Promicromonospora sp. CA-289599]|uniref:histidine phosphatase family protein n=1 Tax=Promicromonospora sp. CA-289599 TaxID=3240014 RepID=UPI003D90F6BB
MTELIPEILLVRHARTQSNSSGTFMGQRDLPASDEGLRAARDLLADKAEAWHVTHLYSSPLLRARQTAELLTTALPIRLDDRLLERNLGVWEGRTKAEVRESDPQAVSEFGWIDARHTPIRGESLDEMCDRIGSFLDEIQRLEPGSVPMVVTHNGWIRAALSVCGLVDAVAIYAEATPHAQVIRLSPRMCHQSRSARLE